MSYVEDGEDHARPCMQTGCTLPGRFIVGIDGGTSTCWCVDHVSQYGVVWLIDLVTGVRKLIGRE